jgi:hypothetical protein
VNVDQPLRLAAFKAQLGQLEPMLRGEPAGFQAAMAMVFQMLHGPLPPAEVARLTALRRPEQAVVLGAWGTVFDSTPEELDATVAALAAAVAVPYLSLHGADPGEPYSAWLRGHVPDRHRRGVARARALSAPPRARALRRAARRLRPSRLSRVATSAATGSARGASDRAERGRASAGERLAVGRGRVDGSRSVGSVWGERRRAPRHPPLPPAPNRGKQDW